jgi:hypothetical protein
MVMASGSVGWAEQMYRIDHAVVRYDGVDESYVKALAETAVAARTAAVEKFNLNMPETIQISVTLNLKQKVRLYNDGNDRMYLTLKSKRNLLKPSESGIFHIYGICHEIGHLAMYRLIRDHSWLTSEAAEGWAHYLGSRLVDEVYAQKKETLWPDSYNYLADGTKRLKAQLAKSNLRGTAKGALLWSQLSGIVDDKGIGLIFQAWSKMKIDPTDPGAAARKTLLAVGANPRLEAWWNQAEPVFIFKRPKSGFPLRQVDRKTLAGSAMELVHDDGAQAGKSSIAGGGHAVRFGIPGDGWYLTSVRLFGSRYGYPRPPQEDFHIWLCDAEMNVIADLPQPYGRFQQGNPRWVNLRVNPTNVPSEFIVCVGFNPTGTKGVFMSYDQGGTGNSLTALPGKSGKSFSKGDWLIRVEVDQLKTADALKPLQ